MPNDKPHKDSRTPDAIAFGPYHLTADGRLEIPPSTTAQLPRRLAIILYELAAARGEPVSRQELLSRCWSGNEVGDESLSRAVSDLRKIFSAHGQDPIESIYGLGYRLRCPDNSFSATTNARRAASICREAWHRVYQRRVESLDTAERFFAQAAETDENSCQGWLGIAETQIHRMQLGYVRTADAWVIAQTAIERALELDPRNANALAFKGLGLAWAERDFGAAERSLHASLQTDPAGFMANECSGWCWVSAGQFNRAKRHFDRAAEARPVAMEARGAGALTDFYAGNSESALRAVRELPHHDPTGPIALGYFSLIEATLGKPRSAAIAAEKCCETLPDSPVLKAVLAYALARCNRVEESRRILDERLPSGNRVGIDAMAGPAWLTLGEKHKALEALHAAMEVRSPWLILMLHDPRLADIRDEPLLRAIRKEVLRK